MLKEDKDRIIAVLLGHVPKGKDKKATLVRQQIEEAVAREIAELEPIIDEIIARERHAVEVKATQLPMNQVSRIFKARGR